MVHFRHGHAFRGCRYGRVQFTIASTAEFDCNPTQEFAVTREQDNPVRLIPAFSTIHVLRGKAISPLAGTLPPAHPRLLIRAFLHPPTV